MATLKDIARQAGVNISTVSRALSGSSEINEDTRRRICGIARELNYIPDLSARALTGKGTGLIGLILPEIGSSFYARVVDRVQLELNRRGFSLLIGVTNFRPDNEIQALNLFAGRKVDGMLVTGSMSEEIGRYLERTGTFRHVPVVLMETYVELQGCESIMIDNGWGIRLAVDYFHACGHRDIGFISEDISCRQRLPGFRTALAEDGLRPVENWIKTGVERFELGGYLRMKELLCEEKVPTAVFASYDSMAFGAMKAILDAGLRVPEDISLIGFDNIRESEFFNRPLTTVSPPVEEMVRLAAGLLEEKLQGQSAQPGSRRILKPELVIRESVRKM